MVSIIILYCNIIILWDHCHICCLLLMEVLLCGTWLYKYFCVLSARKEVPWMVGMMVLDTSSCVCHYIPHRESTVFVITSKCSWKQNYSHSRGIYCMCVSVWTGTYVHRLNCSFVCRFVSVYTYLCQVHGRNGITLWGKHAVGRSKRLKPVALLQHLQHCVTGASEDSGQLALGIYQGSGHVRKLSAVKHNYPDHVVKAAEVGS